MASAGGDAFRGDVDELRRGCSSAGRPRSSSLLAIHDVYPFAEAVFWARLPGVPLGLTAENLERVAAEVAPARKVVITDGEQRAPAVVIGIASATSTRP